MITYLIVLVVGIALGLFIGVCKQSLRKQDRDDRVKAARKVLRDYGVSLEYYLPHYNVRWNSEVFSALVAINGSGFIAICDGLVLGSAGDNPGKTLVVEEQTTYAYSVVDDDNFVDLYRSKKAVSNAFVGEKLYLYQDTPESLASPELIATTLSTEGVVKLYEPGANDWKYRIAKHDHILG